MIEVRENEALVNVTFMGQNGDMASPVPLNASDASILAWATESVRSGTLPGITSSRTADFSGFVVDRFDPTEERPHALFTVRPKTPFGEVEPAALSKAEILDGLLPFIKAADDLAGLNASWPSDGWDGAADARANHHRKVRAAEKTFEETRQQLRPLIVAALTPTERHDA